jgi:hypothetical protein
MQLNPTLPPGTVIPGAAGGQKEGGAVMNSAHITTLLSL